jgi:long-chain fatty acid transport protein
MNQANRTTFSALALGIAGVLAMGQANATGFQLRETSVKNLGRGQAGVATASDDASVVTNNPAAMVNLDKNTVQVDVTAIDISFEFEGGGTSAAGTPLTGGDGGNAGSVQAVPNLSAVFPLHGALEGLTVGAAIGAPFGLKTEYDRDWVGRYNAVESDLKVVDLTLSAAVQLHERFSVGVGFIYERADVTLSNAVDFGSIMAGTGIPGALPQGADGFATVSGDGNGIGWLAGAQWKPTDALTLGFSHRSEVDLDLEGEVEFDTPASFQAAQAVYRLLASNPALPPAQRAQLAVLGNGFGAPGAAEGITAPLTTPSVSTLSATYAVSDSVRVMADAQWTDWSSLRNINIDYANPFQPNTVEDFSWTDTEMYAIGAEWDLSDRFTLRGGVTRDETPTHIETRTPRLPDNDRMLYSIGFTWNVSDAFSVDAAYQRIEIDSSEVDIVSSSNSHLVGEFDGYANLLGVSAQYKF